MNLARALAALLLLVAPAQGADQRAVESRPFDLQGHRGARGLAPENTLAGFATALEIGVTTLELDLGDDQGRRRRGHHDRGSTRTHARPGRRIPRTRPGRRSGRSPSRSCSATTSAGSSRGRAYAAPLSRSSEPADGARIPASPRYSSSCEAPAPTTSASTSRPSSRRPGRRELAGSRDFRTAVAEAVREAGHGRRVIVQSFDWRTLKALKPSRPRSSALPDERGAFRHHATGVAGPSPWTAGLDIDEFGGSVPRLVRGAGCQVWSPSFRDLTGSAQRGEGTRACGHPLDRQRARRTWTRLIDGASTASSPTIPIAPAPSWRRRACRFPRLLTQGRIARLEPGSATPTLC